MAAEPQGAERGVDHEGAANVGAEADEVRAPCGEPAAVLYASQGSIYGRYGYGMASLNAGIDVETSRSAFGPGYTPSGRVRLFERKDPFDRFASVLVYVPRDRFDSTRAENLNI